MNRDKFTQQISDVYKRSTVRSFVTHGDTETNCRRFSTQLYDELTSEENAIAGASFAVVHNILYERLDHAWLLAYHPDVGYLMVDPTIGQFINDGKTGQPYNKVFIGTYKELKKGLSSGKYAYRDDSHDVYDIWSPAICFQKEFDTQLRQHRTYCNPADINKVWKQYEFHIMPDSEFANSAETFGYWAARLQEAGVKNWRTRLHAYLNLSSEEEGDKRYLRDVMAYKERFIKSVSHKANVSP